MSRYRVELHEAAEVEAREGYLFYRSRNPSSAEHFQVRFEDAIAKLENEAHTFPVLEGEIRWLLIEKFPYALIYRVRGEVVTVGAVMQLNRRPGYWKDRSF